MIAFVNSFAYQVNAISCNDIPIYLRNQQTQTELFNYTFECLLLHVSMLIFWPFTSNPVWSTHFPKDFVDFLR